MSYTVLAIETTGDLPWRGDLVAVGLGGKIYKPKPGRTAARLLLKIQLGGRDIFIDTKSLNSCNI